MLLIKKLFYICLYLFNIIWLWKRVEWLSDLFEVIKLISGIICVFFIIFYLFKEKLKEGNLI